MKYFKRLFGRRKCELLRCVERELLVSGIKEQFAVRAQARVLKIARRQALKLERRGIL